MAKRRPKRWFDRPEPTPAERDAQGIVRWNLAMTLALGRLPDREIGRRFVLTFDEIRAKRRERGIKPKAWGKREWTYEMVADLRLLPNRTFQYKYQIDWQQVVAKRRELQIPLPKRGAKFTPQMIALLGKRTDKALARAFMLTPRQIALKRNALGICSYGQQQRNQQRTFAPQELAILGTMSDHQAARRLGVEVKIIRRLRWRNGIPAYRSARWTPEITRLLGKVTDSELARRLHLSDAAVTKKRKELGIPRYSRNWWTKRRVRLLGSAPDAAIAKKLGVCKNTVFSERARRNIPAFNRFAAHLRHNHIRN